MNVRRMLGVAALGAAATSLVFAPGAGAQEEGSAYHGSSSGEALNLSVFGQGLTVASTTASVADDQAAAQGSGLATPVFEAGATAATTAAPGDGAENCEALVDQVPGLSIGLACSSSQVTGADGTQTATATGRVGEIVVDPVDAILGTPLSEVVGPVEDGVDQLLGGLAPVLGPIDDATDLGLEDTLGELFDRLFEGADLVTVTVGDTMSTTTAAAGSVTTACAAEGARIDVLNVLGAEPLISIVVGEAGSGVVVDRATGEGTPTVSPALVTIDGLAVPSPITVPIGQTIEVPLPEPLGSSFIQIADGTTGTNEDGSTFATANAVSIDLLNGEALMGGVELELAGCTSVAGITTAQAPPAEETPTVDVPTQLPTTGSDDTNTLALAGVLGFAGLGLALLRRSGRDA